MHCRIATLSILLLFSMHANAQSEALSELSQLSVELSTETTIAALDGLVDGSRLVIKGIRPLGKLSRLTLQGVADGASITLEVSAAAVATSGMAVGSSVLVTASAAGWLVSAAGHAIAFIPNALAREMIHHREL